MSFAQEVKQEVAQKIMSGNDARAELSALIQLCSSLSLSSNGMSIVVNSENAAVTRRTYTLTKDRYHPEMEMFVKKKMNLKKNRVYGVRITTKAKEILKDLGLYSSRGLLDKPLQKIVQTDNNARAYLAGAFLAVGSVNSPEKTNYHLELTVNTEAHAEFIVNLLDRFNIPAKIINRRNKFVVYVKSAEKIADFLRCIEADQALLDFENVRIERDFSNSITRLNNMDVANEMKTQKAAKSQLEDIEFLEKEGYYKNLDTRLKEVAELRKEFPEASLNELAQTYQKRTGTMVSKSGMKHRFNRIHEFAEKLQKK